MGLSDFYFLCGNSPLGTFYVYCTKGTYIRSLVHDLGQKLGCGGILTQLRRTASNNLSLKDAVTLEHFENEPLSEISKYLIPGYQALTPIAEL